MKIYPYERKLGFTLTQKQKIKSTARRRKSINEADVIRAAVDLLEVDKYLNAVDENDR